MSAYFLKHHQKLYARGFPKLERAYTLKREPNSQLKWNWAKQQNKTEE